MTENRIDFLGWQEICSTEERNPRRRNCRVKKEEFGACRVLDPARVVGPEDDDDGSIQKPDDGRFSDRAYSALVEGADVSPSEEEVHARRAGRILLWRFCARDAAHLDGERRSAKR